MGVEDTSVQTEKALDIDWLDTGRERRARKQRAHVGRNRIETTRAHQRQPELFCPRIIPEIAGLKVLIYISTLRGRQRQRQRQQTDGQFFR